MKKVKLPNLYYKTRANKPGFTIYYLYRQNDKQNYIRLGNHKDTTSIIKARYEDVKSRLWAEKNGFAPVNQAVAEPVQQPVLFKDIYTKFVADESRKHGFSWERDLFNFKSFVAFFDSEDMWMNGRAGVRNSCTIDLAKITSDDLEDYFDNEAQNHSKSTINCRHKYIRPLYRWLVRKGHLETNTYEAHDKAIQKDDSIKYQALPMDVVKQIIDSTDVHEYKVLWTIMAYTGLAPIDAGNLSKTDDVVSNGTFDCIITKRSKTRVQAQIPILGDLAKLGDLIFTLNMNKNQRDDANSEFVKIVKQLGVETKKGYKVAQYSLRHSLATFLRVHLTDNELALILGHTNTKQQLTYTSPEAIELHRKLAGVLK